MLINTELHCEANRNCSVNRSADHRKIRQIVLRCGIEIHDPVLVVCSAVRAGLSLARMSMARHGCELHVAVHTYNSRASFGSRSYPDRLIDIAATTASLSQSQSRRGILLGIRKVALLSMRSSSTPSRIEPPL